jgi:ATP-dependent DNA helicase HFM1/MER3
VPYNDQILSDFSSRYGDDSSPLPLGQSSSPVVMASQRHIHKPNGSTIRDLEIGGCHSISRIQDSPNPPGWETHELRTVSRYIQPHHPTPVVQGIQLVQTLDLPDRFRSVFPYPLFNAVQSKCFDIVFRSDDNFTVSAPTGSGKTGIMELAICRMMDKFSGGQYKIVYQAPTKALCSERQRDWQARFGPLGLSCAELTGDTDQNLLTSVKNASIIITTPEKWDSITRKWKDHERLMRLIKLFLIDEVHILKEDRGATLEVVVSRMKSFGTQVRFIALSATVPNSEDIATWLGRDSAHQNEPSQYMKFGEEFRPVKLQKHVCGYRCESNDFAFDKWLDKKQVLLTPYKRRTSTSLIHF